MSRAGREHSYSENSYKCKGFFCAQPGQKEHFDFDANSIGRKFHFTFNVGHTRHTHVYLLGAILCIISSTWIFLQPKKRRLHVVAQMIKIKTLEIIHEFDWKRHRKMLDYKLISGPSLHINWQLWRLAYVCFNNCPLIIVQ